MSRIYFHSPSGDAEVPGTERAWMGCLTDDIGLSLTTANAIRRLDEWMTVRLFDDLKPVTAMSNDQLASLARLRFLRDPDGIHGHAITYQGRGIGAWDLSLNTCLRIGSPTVQLAARLHAQCEIHAWVDGPNRAWLASLIDSGMRAGTFRETDPRYTTHDGQPTGWRPVMDLLRSRDDEPVVCSYSVCDQFPNAEASTWMPAWPDDVPEEWGALTEVQQQDRQRRSDAWYDLPAEEQWRHGMEHLRSGHGHLELVPGEFGDGAYHFGLGLSWLDLDARDAEGRVRKALGLDEEATRG